MLLASDDVDISGATQDQIRVVRLGESDSPSLLVWCITALELSQVNQLFSGLTIWKIRSVQTFLLMRLRGFGCCRCCPLKGVVETKFEFKVCICTSDGSLEVVSEHLPVLGTDLPSSVGILTSNAVLELIGCKESSFSPAIELGLFIIGLIVLSQEWIAIPIHIVRNLRMKPMLLCRCKVRSKFSRVIQFLSKSCVYLIALLFEA